MRDLGERKLTSWSNRGQCGYPLGEGPFLGKGNFGKKTLVRQWFQKQERRWGSPIAPIELGGKTASTWGSEPVNRKGRRGGIQKGTNWKKRGDWRKTARTWEEEKSIAGSGGVHNQERGSQNLHVEAELMVTLALGNNTSRKAGATVRESRRLKLEGGLCRNGFRKELREHGSANVAGQKRSTFLPYFIEVNWTGNPQNHLERLSTVRESNETGASGPWFHLQVK